MNSQSPALLKWLGQAFVWFLIFISVLAGVATIGILWMGYSWKRELDPKYDPDLYREVTLARKKLYPEAYALFPATIENDAVDVAFAHQPGFLQGGDLVVLRLRLSESKIAEILSSLQSSDRKEITNFEDILNPPCYPKFGLKEAKPRNFGEALDMLPSNFRTFLLATDLEALKADPNHGFVAFTAVSVERSEVVYFAEGW